MLVRSSSSKPPSLEIIAAEAFNGTKVESYKCKIRDHLNTVMTRFQLNEDQVRFILQILYTS